MPSSLSLPQVRPDQREVRYWMKYFSNASNPNKPFAVIQISDDVFRLEQKEQVPHAYLCTTPVAWSVAPSPLPPYAYLVLTL